MSVRVGVPILVTTEVVLYPRVPGEPDCVPVLMWVGVEGAVRNISLLMAGSSCSLGVSRIRLLVRLVKSSSRGEWMSVSSQKSRLTFL